MNVFGLDYLFIFEDKSLIAFTNLLLPNNFQKIDEVILNSFLEWDMKWLKQLET